MGPHGLCVGATGSGKSEFLRTLALGLVATHAPDELNLVLVDFKGGATFLGFERLRHVAAVVTNLSEEAHLVARMRDALAGEMTRRQRVLRAAGNFPNVGDYDAARARGADLAPLPALLIIVDEFSELLSQHPDFAELFVAIGRLGRSLGMHLLLASQRLDEGRLRGLETHLSYRICLKTFSASESRAVLGTADAYELPATPGRGHTSRRRAGDLVRFRDRVRLRAGRPAPAPPTPDVVPTRFTARRARQPVAAEPRAPADRAPLLDVVVDGLAGPGRRRRTGCGCHRWTRRRRSARCSPQARRRGRRWSCRSGWWTTPSRSGATPCSSTCGPRAATSPSSAARGRGSRPHCTPWSSRWRPPTTPTRCRSTGSTSAAARCRRCGRCRTSVRSRAGSTASSPAGSSRTCRDWCGERETRREAHGRRRAARRRVPGGRRLGGGASGVRRHGGGRHRDRRAGALGRRARRRRRIAVGRHPACAQGSARHPHRTAPRRPGRLGDGPQAGPAARRPARRATESPATDSNSSSRCRDCRRTPTSVRRRLRADAAAVRPATPVARPRPCDCCRRGCTTPTSSAQAGDAVGHRSRARTTCGPSPIDFAAHPHLLILGDTECGKTRRCARCAARSCGPAGRPPPASSSSTSAGRCSASSSPTTCWATRCPLPRPRRTSRRSVSLLSARLPGEGVTQQQLRDRSWWSGPEVYVVVDDYDLVAGRVGQSAVAAARLAAARKGSRSARGDRPAFRWRRARDVRPGAGPAARSRLHRADDERQPGRGGAARFGASVAAACGPGHADPARARAITSSRCRGRSRREPTPSSWSGPRSIGGPGAVDPELASVALECIDDELALVDDRVVPVDELWSRRAGIGDGRPVRRRRRSSVRRGGRIRASSGSRRPPGRSDCGRRSCAAARTC